MSQRNLYALFVGIDNYAPPVPPLAGCVNDMLAMRDFITQRTNYDGFRLHEKVLTDAEATRLNIVDAFENHLGQAGSDDVVFFYYSGHGSQEPAHESFWEYEPDRMNETIVCYDSRIDDGMDLADKELATLIELVTSKGPHFVVVMDCCNSGSGTRNLPGDDEPEFIARQSASYDYVRSLDSYILPKDDTGTRGVLGTAEQQKIIIPSGRHVALSAANSFELAKETRLGGQRRGVFTYSLLEVLNSISGNPSYSDIMQRVRTLVTQRTYDQNPRLYSRIEKDLNLTFLGQAFKEKTDTFLLKHDPDKGWVLNAGGVHGILAPTPRGVRTELAVYPEDSSASALQDDRQMLGEISVYQVSPDHSLVDIPAGLGLDIQQDYLARITSLPVLPMRVCIRGNDKEGIKLAEQAFKESTAKQFLELVGRSADADYNLIAKKSLSSSGAGPEGYIINRPTDRDDQPLAEQIPHFSLESADKAIENLNHIARWARILQIANPNSRLDPSVIQMELLDEYDRPIRRGLGGYIFAYTGENYPQFKLKISNTGAQRLYCAMLYLSSQFGIETQIFSEGGVWLEPGESAFAADGQLFTAVVRDELLAFGKNQTQEVFKLIVSTTEYDSSDLRQDELNLPKVQYRSTEDVSTRALMFRKQTDVLGPDWNSTEFTIQVRKD